MVFAASTQGFVPWLRPFILYRKQSYPPALDNYCLDDHLLPTIWQPEGMAASQGEKKAEVCHEVQMAWYLNMLPQGYVQLERHKLR